MSDTVRRARLLLAAASLVLSGRAATAHIWPGPWVELGAGGKLSVRVVVPSGVSACPRVVADGSPVEARQRGDADGDFAVTVCVADVPVATAALDDRRQAAADIAGDGRPDRRVRRYRVPDRRQVGAGLQRPERWPFPVIAKGRRIASPTW